MIFAGTVAMQRQIYKV